jgi:membrane protein
VPDQSTSEDDGPGWVKRAAAWSKTTAKTAEERAAHARKSHLSVDVGFRTAERQRRVAAMVLAGGIAYRIFFWLLAVSVVAGGVLGFFDPNGVQSALEKHGVTGWEAMDVAQLTRSSDANEWWLLLVGGWLVLWTGYTCSNALAHATIWEVAPPKLDRPLRTSLLFSGYTLGFIAAMAAARYVREESQIGGFAATMLVLGVAFGFWLVVSHNLPNAATGWLELMPGAVIVAVGLQALHLFTVYFLGTKIESATELYGLLGIVTTLLFWFYLGGRLIVSGATLNVEFTELRAGRRHGATAARPRGGRSG